MFTLQKLCPITSVDFVYNHDYESLWIYVGDEMGYVWVQNASEILHMSKVKEIDLVTGNNKWNPFRKIEINEENWTEEYDYADATKSLALQK